MVPTGSGSVNMVFFYLQRLTWCMSVKVNPTTHGTCSNRCGTVQVSDIAAGSAHNLNLTILFCHAYRVFSDAFAYLPCLPSSSGHVQKRSSLIQGTNIVQVQKETGYVQRANLWIWILNHDASSVLPNRTTGALAYHAAKLGLAILNSDSGITNQ
jgi:hypothetical protein